MYAAVESILPTTNYYYYYYYLLPALIQDISHAPITEPRSSGTDDATTAAAAADAADAAIATAAADAADAAVVRLLLMLRLDYLFWAVFRCALRGS